MEKFLETNLSLAMVRATEAAALAAGRWIGLGNFLAADKAATGELYRVINKIAFDGTIVIGEERRHPESEKLLFGAKIGMGKGPKFDVVVDAIDGTNLLAQGQNDAISVVAATPSGSMETLTSSQYMDKLVVSRDAAPALGPQAINAPPAWILGVVAKELGKPVRELSVFVLNRPRHKYLIEELRMTGAKVMLRQEADLLGALLAAIPENGVDILMGIGGTPEGIVGAAATKALRGAFFGRIKPQSDDERQAVLDAGLDPKKIWSAEELITSDNVYFAATGITKSQILPGVEYSGEWATTHSLILRGGSDTRRHITAEHHLEPHQLL